ncbi:hypothetical protein JOE63_002585 [Cellulosimicrobium cellulans]|uniref:hypothetical protein n=1 Tax=Cellulosimicrobium cellulans TaxID=1710 RepID=UPI00195A7F62|nr:hypothetical protein [Cellulosimicrobium cellulans]MBM7820108.1 hypothetical protein [Cellulosimicrobium cellulans]
MSAGATRTQLEATAADWASWLASNGLTDPGAMTAYPTDELLAGLGADLAGHRVYCGIGHDGVADYVGQTRRPLRERIAGHVRNGNAALWSWIVSVSVVGLSAVQVDALERSAHLWMIPPSRRQGRKTPAAR